MTATITVTITVDEVTDVVDDDVAVLRAELDTMRTGFDAAVARAREAERLARLRLDRMDALEAERNQARAEVERAVAPTYPTDDRDTIVWDGRSWWAAEAREAEIEQLRSAVVVVPDELEELLARAQKQAAAHARMLEIGEGVGGLGVKHPDMFEDMQAWDAASENHHADTVLRLLALMDESERAFTVPSVRRDRLRSGIGTNFRPEAVLEHVVRVLRAAGIGVEG